MAAEEAWTLEDACLRNRVFVCICVRECINVFSVIDEIKNYELSALCHSLTLGLYLFTSRHQIEIGRTISLLPSFLFMFISEAPLNRLKAGLISKSIDYCRNSSVFNKKRVGELYEGF